jgi:hypothetical protein
MPPTLVPQQDLPESTKKDEHPDCVACSTKRGEGLALKFLVREDGGVEATFAARKYTKAIRDFCLAASLQCSWMPRWQIASSPMARPQLLLA